MMALARIKQVAPYIMLIFGGAVLYRTADQIYYTPMPGQIGPDLWPKILLVLMVLVCAVEIGRIWFLPGRAKIPETNVDESHDAEEAADEEQEDNPLRVMGVIAATIVYLLCLETGGFFLCTLVYTTCLMWLGGVRRAFPLILLPLVITFSFTFMFMKIIFVSLPIGAPPFSDVTGVVMTLLGIH
jgi:putative tricarboxylic transport membrane protein